MTASPAPLLVAIYVRFSSDMQSPRSCDDQIRECVAYAESQGWKVALIERDDAVRAGAVAGRAGYARVVAAAKAGKFQILLVEEHSRFSRDFWGGLAEIASLRKVGVRLADTKSGIVDADTAFGQLRLAFSLVTSQQETQRLGERSKRGLKGKVLAKFSGGGQPPYGYRRVPIFSNSQVDVDGRPLRVGVRFEPDAVEGPVARRIFQMFADGASKHGIATQLNRENVPTRRSTQLRNGYPHSGAWSPATIIGMLNNEIYSGVRDWNKTSRKGEKHPNSGKKEQLANDTKEWVHVEQYVPAIVDAAMWERVQARLGETREKYKREHIANEKKRYLLSGLLRCANCGASFVIGAHRGNPPTPHYRCSFHAARGRTVCTNAVVVGQVALESRVKELMDSVVKDPAQLKALVAEHNQQVASANEGQLAVVHSLEQRRHSIEGELERLVRAVAIGKKPAKVLVAEVEKLETELDEVVARIDETRKNIQPRLVPRLPAVADYKRGKASLFTNERLHDRAVAEKAISSILVYANGSIVVQFREASLFEPVQNSVLESAAFKHAEDLVTRRAKHQKALDDQLGTLASHLTPDQLAGLEADAYEDSNGNPAYVLMTKGAGTRTFGPGAPRTRAPGEITNASPGRPDHSGNTAAAQVFEACAAGLILPIRFVA